MAQQNKMYAGDYDSQSDGWPPPSAASAGCGALTPRDLYLMRAAYEAGQISLRRFDDWLSADCADGVTVGMVLAKGAP